MRFEYEPFMDMEIVPQFLRTQKLVTGSNDQPHRIS